MKMRKGAVLTAMSVAALMLAACGGGGSDGSKTPVDEGGAPASVATVAEFASAPRPASAPSASALSLTDAADQSLELGVDWLSSQLPSEGNVAAVLPLAQSVLHSFRHAARGDTRTQVETVLGQSVQRKRLLGLPLPPVERKVWAQTGQSFYSSFLEQSQYSSPGNPVSAWVAQESDLRAVKEDPLQALAGLQTVTQSGSSFDRAKLLQVDRFGIAVPLAGGQRVNMVWRGGVRWGALIVPAIKLSNDVVSFAGPDYTAAAVRLGNYRLIQLAPASGSIASVQAGWLKGAILSVLDQWRDGQGSPGELFLVRAELSGDTTLLTEGLTLPFDAFRADLRGLDPQGGNYLRLSRPRVLVDPMEQSLAVSAEQGLAYMYSPSNVNQGGGSGGGWGQVSSGRPSCGGLPEIGPSVLVVLDAQGQVLALLGVREPSLGSPCDSF